MKPLVLSCMYFKTADVAGLRIFYREAGDPSKPTFEVCRTARGQESSKRGQRASRRALNNFLLARHPGEAV